MAEQSTAADNLNPDETERLGLDESEQPLFDSNLRKKKKKKERVVAFDEISVSQQETAEPAKAPGSTSNNIEVEQRDEETKKSSEDLDFSDLIKKKKKKKVTLDLGEDDLGGGKDDDADGTRPEEGSEKDKANLDVSEAVTSEEFADLKKKKKNKKKAFDLEAFERELAQVEGSISTKPTGKEKDDGEKLEDDDEDQDNELGAKTATAEDNLFGRGDDDDQELEAMKSKAQIAAEKKAWLKEPDRDYTYDELLGRFYQALYLSHPSLSAGGTKKRYTLAPPSVHREGNKRSIWANVAEICKKMHRQPEHVIQFLFAELGTSGSVDGNGNLVIKGRFQQKQIENVLRRYIVEYVTCKTCKSPDTLLEKDNRLYFVTCESCGSKRSVSAIKTGFSAQIGKRKTQKG
ncbi:eukaryotic translation initiation factor 2 subunit beta [Phakopsora pachyrhizi]|uniref:Eukaryotic translation initiation factor 2 subunit beta n=1 Tax=Phakopsora pachyrhizi TaxID=170000 RepID=A0AAV0BW55_PHAPC|nr:eukaryotic translation initiation factor 2 subunit beta [Phakopsora pachyrhizi]CAH7690714.1 eukaryotic translation initiation factor 2 subunit beta [Phakopsora pachyrhizi]